MSSTSSSDRTQVISAFLSHSYGAPAANLFFYELNSNIATITFRVDLGKFSTSTTRLERMIRDADAFVGVWPLPGEPGANWEQDELANQSRYFRLELDIAIRAHKPGIVFTDKRYGRLLQTPPEIERLSYDAQEISLSTNSPSWSLLRAKVKRYWRDVRPQLAGRPLTASFEDGRVGVLFGRYSDVDAAGVAEEAVSRRGLYPVRLPTTLDIACLNELRRCDWVIADVTDPTIEAMTAFLHGHFIPVMRTRRVTGQAAPSAVDAVLFGDLTVGYRKDVTHWSVAAELRDGLLGRLGVITQQATLVGDRASATAYFSSAAKRKEIVFLSYAHEDAAMAEQFATALRHRFQEVFDYRADSSLRIGEYWQDQINHKLSATAIGVILFSEHYGHSGYCMDEGRDLYDGFVTGRAKLLPVKLDETRVPAPLSRLQYARIRERNPAEIVENFVHQLG
jgi:hypothetical protein